MKETRTHSIRPTLRGLVLGLAVLALSSQVVRATPFASCITNDGSGNITFYLNEGGANVTVTYDGGGIGNTNATFNGVGTFAAGPHTFSLTGHSTYSISVYKVGSGIPSTLTTISRGGARGVAANTRGASPYFGYVYSAIGGAGVVMQHSDGSGSLGTALEPPINGGSGDQWQTAYAAAEAFVSVAPDDYVLVSDFTGNVSGEPAPPSSGWEGGIIRVDPGFTTANLLLPGLYSLNSPATLPQNHGTIESRAILSDVMANNPMLYVIDGSGFLNFNQIVVYSNITSASLGSPTYGWPNWPDYISPSTVVAGLQGNGYQGYFRAGLALGTNGYLYLSQDRNNLSNPNLQVWNTDRKSTANTNDLYAAMNPVNANNKPANANLWPSMPVVATNMLWCSYYFTTTSINAYSQLFSPGVYINDYTLTGTPAVPELGTAPAELSLSPDNRYLALVHDDAHVTIFTLTNGIPDLASEYLVTGLIPTGTGAAGRYIGWDAAGNLWVADRDYANVYYISLGRTATSITSGNASGPTGFQLVSPTEVDVTQSNPNVPFASQANPYNKPNHT